ncbi:hypothetical protein QQF64_010036 [Cirrhinus molitorella]|uniref:UPAR/Ly6 domain-containing protein n=1 Tax=Cirrhinus molitorella TaxID=172907 RepID=A0ABR3M2V8_9TELE
MTPNGIHCFTCNGEDCAATLPCVDEEDHCIKATVNSDGQMMTMRGCATESFCRGDLSSQSSQSSIAADQSCCKGHLCNSAQTATASRFFQLGILMYAILQTSF